MHFRHRQTDRQTDTDIVVGSKNDILDGRADPIKWERAQFFVGGIILRGLSYHLQW